MTHPTCPYCGGTRFELSVLQTIKVEFNPDNVYDGDPHEVTDGPYGDMEWDDSDRALCLGCGHVDTLGAMHKP